MMRIARTCLAAGCAVVADAVFLRPEDRGGAEKVAEDAGATFEGVWLESTPEVLRERLAGRRNDASDADAKVLAAQLTADPGAIEWRRSASVDTAATLENLLRRLSRPNPKTPFLA